MSRRYGTVEVDRTGRLGFYGCAGDRGRLIRCAYVGPGKAPRSAMVACPACGITHRVAPSWRRGTERDEGREPEVVIAGEEVGS